jgi:crotonobetainyl-CoA:carnitine CoA-transferase CaiB-like acyl-CoA transferase/putative sterol carrier protein
MEPVTPAQLFQSVTTRFRAEKADGVTLTFHFDISAPGACKYTIAIAIGECTVAEGLHGTADCLIETDGDTYVGLETGVINPQDALMQGKVKVSNLMNMLAFAKLFKKYEINTVTQQGRGKRQLPSGPLTGVRVVDFTRLLPGPLATMFMAEMGAEVLKIEDINSPDYIRTFPPFINGVSAYYLALNAGKYSISVDLRTEKQRLIDLIKTADVLVEQYRPGVMANMGLGYEKLKEINPRLIYISITGYGQSNSNAQLAGHDLNYLAASGLLGLNKDANGKPVMPGFQLADVGGGSYIALAACTAALYEREKTGIGKFIDVSMANAVVPLLALPFASQQAQGQTITELGGALANYNIYCCADGKYVALGALEPKFWAGFCAIINKHEWINLIAKQDAATVNALKNDLEAVFSQKPAAEWEALGNKADVCITVIRDLEDLATDSFLNETGAFNTIVTDGHKVKTMAFPVNFSGTKNNLPAAPFLGEDNNLF